MEKRERDRYGNDASASAAGGQPAAPTPGKRTLAETQPRPSADRVQRTADAGVARANAPLPHRDIIQRAFGRHAVQDVKATVGGDAAEATGAIGAAAYAKGDRVAFAKDPDLHTAAHEAAHVVQQRRGVELDGGVGKAGDAYEKHADAVADRVVAQESAESLLEAAPGGGGGASEGVQRKELPFEEVEETPAMFFDRAAATIHAEVANMMAANDLEIGSPYLCWAVGTFGTDVVNAAFGLVTNYVSMKRLLVGTDFDAAMTRAHADDNAATSMAIELKGIFLGRIAASLSRISPRYVIARHQALLRAEAAAKHALPADSAPQPGEGEVITSHPLDRHVLARFRAGAVKWNSVEQFRKDHPEEAKQHAIAKVRTPVDLTVKNARWVHVTKPEDATVEEVARELFGTTEGAVFLTKASPLFGIEPAAWKTYPLSKYRPKTPTAADLALDESASAAAGLVGVPEAAAVGAKQSETLVADGLGAEGVGTRLSLLRLTIGDIAKSTAKLGLSQTVAPVLVRIAKREKELAAGAPHETVTSYDANSKAQLQIVSLAHAGVTQAVEAVAQVAAPPPSLKGGGAAQAAFDKLVGPARALAGAYLDAIALSDLPDTAKTKLAEADALSTTFPIDMANAVLEQVRRMLDGAESMAASAKTTAKKGAKDIDLGRELELELRLELVELRATVATNPKVAYAKLAALQTKLQDVLQIAQTAVAVWGLQSLIEQLAVSKSTIGGLSGKNDDYDEFIKKLGMFSQTFKDEVFTPYTTGDTEAKKAAVQKFERLKTNPVLVDLQKDLPQIIKNQEEFEHWLGFFMMLGVSFTAGVIGGAVGAWSGFAHGSWRLILLEAGAEAAASTAYTTAIQKDPTLDSIVLGFAQSMGNAAAMKAVLPGLKAELTPKVGKGATEVVTLGGVFASTAIQKLAVAMVTDPHLTDEKIDEILRDTAAEVIGGAVYNHFAEKFLAPISPKIKHDAALKAKLDAFDATRKALADEALALKAAAKAEKKAKFDALLKKATIQTGEELTFLKLDLAEVMKNPASGIDPEMLADVTESLQRTQYLFRKQIVLDKLTHVAGDTYLVDPKQFTALSQELRDLGFEAIGEETHEPLPGKSGRSIRFEGKKGAGAPPEAKPRPIRLCENGPPVEHPTSVSSDEFAGVVKKLATGQVPRVVDLPNTVSNLKAHIVLEKIAADPLLQGPLADLKAAFLAEYAARLSVSPPETDMLGRLKEILTSPEGTSKYLRKGPPMTDPDHVAELGGLYRVISLRALIANQLVTQDYYRRVVAASPDPKAFPAQIVDVAWKHAIELAKIINEHGLYPTTTAKDLNVDATVAGRGEGSSAWWNSGHDAMPKGAAKTNIPDLVASLAVASDYLEGCLMIELPALVAAGKLKPTNTKGDTFDGTARRPTALDAFIQDLFVANPDPNAPEGKTAPDPASGRPPVREAVVGPVPLGATRFVQYLVGK